MIFSLLIITHVLFENPCDTSLGDTGSWSHDINAVLVKQFQPYDLSDVMLFFKIIMNLLYAHRFLKNTCLIYFSFFSFMIELQESEVWELGFTYPVRNVTG